MMLPAMNAGNSMSSGMMNEYWNSQLVLLLLPHVW